jgi:penicillin-binding protein 2
MNEKPMVTKSIHWIAFLMVLLLTACGVLPPLPGQSATNEAGSPVPQQQSGRTPEQTARSFLDAWAIEDFETMYSLVSPRILQVYPFDDFRAQYSNADSEMGFESVTYAIQDVRVQGTSAAITYDATLESSTFGAIEDTGRIMRLVSEGGGWHVAWSPMDILNGMTSSVRLRSERRFPVRGTIYDRNGLPLVQDNGTAVIVYLLEQDIRDVEACFSILARLMMRPYPYLEELANQYSNDVVYFVGEMDSELYEQNRSQIDEFCATDIDAAFGAKIQQVTGRTYFGHGAAAHITGYMAPVPAEQLEAWERRGYASGDTVGIVGIENTFQDELAGTPEQFLRLQDTSGGVVLRELGGAVGTDPLPVQLTIDRTMQLHLAQAFNDGWNYAVTDWASVATGGAGVVLDVNTGAVLAMFSYPTYDPRIFNPQSTYFNTGTTFAAASSQVARAVNGDPFFPVGSAMNNRAIGEQYSPGSTFKIVTTLAAADTGIWGRDQIFECELTWEGGAQFGDALEFREDWRVSLGEDAAGPITMSQALTTSCNPFFWQVGALMFRANPNTVADYARMLGLGAVTGLNTLGYPEVSGVIPQPSDITSALNNAIGQGNTNVTAMQMARLTSAIANGGTLYRPYIVEQVGGLDGTEVTQEFEPTVVSRLEVSPEALDVVRTGMCNVPIDEELGTASYLFYRAPYSSCAKTGTAQTGAFAPHSWYVAYAPADNPQIAIAVVVSNSREGSEVAAPIIRRFLENYFNVGISDFPEWWQWEYVPLTPPQGVGG